MKRGGLYVEKSTLQNLTLKQGNMEREGHVKRISELLAEAHPAPPRPEYTNK